MPGLLVFSSSSSVIQGMRLANSTVATEGRLEINYGGIWGTVCDDYFDDRDASVACHMLGSRYWSNRGLHSIILILTTPRTNILLCKLLLYIAIWKDKSQARRRGVWGRGFKLPPPTRLKDDSWDLHKSDEIFLPLRGEVPLHSGMAFVTTLQNTACSTKPSRFLLTTNYPGLMTDVWYRTQNIEKSLGGRGSAQTRWVELTALPRPPS